MPLDWPQLRLVFEHSCRRHVLKAEHDSPADYWKWWNIMRADPRTQFVVRLPIFLDVFLINNWLVLAVYNADHKTSADNSFVIVDRLVAFQPRWVFQVNPVATLWRKHLLNNCSALREMRQNHRCGRLRESKNCDPEARLPWRNHIWWIGQTVAKVVRRLWRWQNLRCVEFALVQIRIVDRLIRIELIWLIETGTGHWPIRAI